MAFTYIDVDNGNDANNGLSEATPKLTGGHIDWSSANPDYQIFLKGNTTNYLEYVYPASGARSARPVISVFPSEINTGVKGKLRITKSLSSSVNHSGFTFIDLDIDDNNTATGNSGFHNGYCLRCNLDMVSITQNSQNVSPLTFDLGTVYQPTSGTVYWNPAANAVVKDSKMVDFYPNAGSLRLVNSVAIVRDSYTATIANTQTFYNSAIVYRSTSAATTGAIFSNGFATCLNTHIINLKNNNRPIILSALNISVGSIRTYGISLTNFVDNGMGGATDITVLSDEFESTDEANLLTTYMKIKATSDAVDAGIGGADIGWAVLASGGYPLLDAADVKIGVDRGDGTTGTYDGSDRYTDIDLTQVVNGYNFRYNSLTNNRTGTRTAIYDLLAANLVKIGQDRGDGVTGTYDAAERYTDLDLSFVDSTYSFRYNSLSNNRTGTKIFYPPLPTNKVAIGEDRGDGQTGTYAATERYSDIDLSQVVSGYAYRYNSLSNNRTGTRTSIYALLNTSVVQFGVDRGDGATGTDKGENFNSVLTAGQIKVGEVVDNLGNEITGTYTATERYTDLDLTQVVSGYNYRYNSLTDNRTGTRTAIYNLLDVEFVKIGQDRGDGETGTYAALERYTDIPVDKVENDYDYIYNDEPRTGTLVGGDAGSIPAEKVIYPYEYAPGVIGQAGKYNPNDTDIVTQLNTNAKNLIQHILGNDWKEMAYFKEPELNDFYTSDLYFGIRPMADNELETLISTEEVEVEFEIKLLKQFENNGGDEAERQAELFLIEQMTKLRRANWHSNMGNYQQNVLISGINRDECEKIGPNLMLCRLVITINYAVINNL
jgi:autonomous glycyl radical cofactor GrcA